MDCMLYKACRLIFLILSNRIFLINLNKVVYVYWSGEVDCPNLFHSTFYVVLILKVSKGSAQSHL